MKYQNYFNNTYQLTRSVVLAGAALLLAVLSFGGYYYWDRYIHIGDVPPVQKSVQELETAVRADPNNPDLHLNLAETYMYNEQYDQAIQQAQQVVNADPQNERGLFVMGLSSAMQKNYEKAIEPLKGFAAIREKSEMANTDMALETSLYHLGVAYLQFNHLDEALTALERAIQINHTDADALYQLGLAYTRSGKNDQAIASLEKAVLLVPDFKEAYQAMAEAYTAANQPDYAAYAQSMVAFCLKDYPTARTGLEKAIASLPDFAPAYIGLGLTFEELGDLQAAQSQLQHAVQLDSNNFTASQALGRVQNKIGQ